MKLVLFILLLYNNLDLLDSNHICDFPHLLYMTNGSERMFQEIANGPLWHANGVNKEFAGNTNDIIDIHNTLGSKSGFILGIVKERHDIVKFLEHLGNE
jgi:hypothetical protein